MQVTAVQAAPDDLFRLLEDGAVLEVFEQSAIAALMLLLGDADRFPHRGDFREPFFARLDGERGVEMAPLFILAGGGFHQVGNGVGDDSGRKSGGDLNFSAFEELEEALGVLLLLVGGLFENLRNLNVSRLAGDAGKIGVAVARLGFPGERFEQVLFGFGALNGFHNAFSSIIRARAVHGRSLTKNSRPEAESQAARLRFIIISRLRRIPARGTPRPARRPVKAATPRPAPCRDSSRSSRRSSCGA